MKAVSLLLLNCVLSATAQDQDGCEFLHVMQSVFLQHFENNYVPPTKRKYESGVILREQNLYKTKEDFILVTRPS